MRKGFTLFETMFAVAILGLVVSMAMGTWLLFMYKSNRANTQVSLDMDVRSVIEKFRSEIRNTARETIIFYPQQREPYEAVGFALAGDQDGDGLMDMKNAGSNILWRQTVVYHVWNHSPHQMRRTVFSNRNADASYADRYNQIASVVTSGDGEGSCLDGEVASTSVLFENLFTGKLWHAEARFDGYAPQPNRRERVTFGSLPLGPGEHTVNFTIIGKNPDATGRQLRLDQVNATLSGWPMEAELCAVGSGGAASGPDFVGQGLASAAYGLTAATAAEGDKLSLTIHNDAIEECVFIGEGRNVSFSNTVVRFDMTNAPADFENGVYVTKLDGQYKTAWWGSSQAFGASPDAVGHDFLSYPQSGWYYPGTNLSIRIPVDGTYVRADGFGPVFRLFKTGNNDELQIWYAGYGFAETNNSPNLTTNLVRLAFYQNGARKTSWINCSRGVVELRPDTTALEPVYMGQNMILSLGVTVGSTTPGNDGMRMLPITPPATWRCWCIKGAAAWAVWPQWPGFLVEPVLTASGTPVLPLLMSMVVNYAETGTYVSHVFDTKSDKGASKSIMWEANVPAGSTLSMYARGGNTLTDDGFDISDASAWENLGEVSNGGFFSGNTGRYVQFRAVYTAQPASSSPETAGGLGSAGPYRSDTPRLRRVLFTWDGEEKYVDIAAELLKSPDCGIFKVDVDGRDLVQGVTMEIEIFKDVLTQGAAKERLRSSLTAEVEPRNSGK
mgnify:CR=1 FL=1